MEAESDEADQQVILEEEIDENYEPTDQGTVAAAPNQHKLLSHLQGPPLKLTTTQRSWSMPNGLAWTCQLKQ